MEYIIYTLYISTHILYVVCLYDKNISTSQVITGAIRLQMEALGDNVGWGWGWGPEQASTVFQVVVGDLLELQLISE